MTITAAATSAGTQSAAGRLLLAGFTTGIVDGLFSSVLSIAFYDSTVARLFQYVASTLLGPEAFEGGATTALIGVAMHFGVAFGWSGVVLLFIVRSPRFRRVLAARYGVVAVAAIYGPFIWMVMSLAVIPLLTQRPTEIGFRWWVQFVGHIPFVAIPIIASLRPRRGRSTRRHDDPLFDAALSGQVASDRNDV